METHLTPTFYGCLCIGVIACALIMPQGLAAVDRLLAGQPERFDLDNWGTEIGTWTRYSRPSGHASLPP